MKILEDPIQDEAIMTKKGEIMGYRCRFRILYTFENPLKIKEMRNSPMLSEWYPLKVRFIRMVFNIEVKYWKFLRETSNYKIIQMLKVHLNKISGVDKMAGECYITTVKDFTFVNGKTRIEYIL